MYDIIKNQIIEVVVMFYSSTPYIYNK